MSRHFSDTHNESPQHACDPEHWYHWLKGFKTRYLGTRPGDKLVARTMRYHHIETDGSLSRCDSVFVVTRQGRTQRLELLWPRTAPSHDIKTPILYPRDGDSQKTLGRGLVVG